VIDPGDEAEQILDLIKAHAMTVVGLWHSHAHIDHIGATKSLFDELSSQQGAPIKVWLHPEDRWLYDHVDVQAGLLGLEPFAVTQNIDALKSGSVQLPNTQTLHTPGHTPGSCCLSVGAATEFEIASQLRSGLSSEAPKVLVAGDTLFRRSIGRTDLWGGDFATIEQSIQKKIYSLAPETYVIPGHGPLTRIEEERDKNPFVRPLRS
jgi:glyoxylase-like metal-dependent hydrolase (beta-lactamase superfamily II)